MDNLLVVYVSHNRGGKNKWVTFNGQDKRPKPSTTVPVHISLFVFHRDFQVPSFNKPFEYERYKPIQKKKKQWKVRNQQH